MRVVNKRTFSGGGGRPRFVSAGHRERCTSPGKNRMRSSSLFPGESLSKRGQTFFRRFGAVNFPLNFNYIERLQSPRYYIVYLAGKGELCNLDRFPYASPERVFRTRLGPCFPRVRGVRTCGPGPGGGIAGWKSRTFCSSSGVTLTLGSIRRCSVFRSTRP